MIPPTKDASVPETPPLVVRLDRFDKTIGLDRGKPFWFEVLWYLVKMAFFLSAFPYPNSFRRRLLILFGAKIGTGFVIRPGVNIHMPWKLVIGDYCWIGDSCEFLNLAPVTIGDHTAIAHEVSFTTGNHDYKDHTMSYRNAPIRIGRGCWLASRVFIGPGVTVGEHSIVTAGSVVTKSVPPWKVVQGNPAEVVRSRVLTR